MRPMPRALFIALFAVAPLAVAEIPIANQCVGCHEIPGYKTAYPTTYPVPRIAGQSAAYIEAALAAYRAGERSHPSMSAIAAQLTAAEIKALAAHYAKK